MRGLADRITPSSLAIVVLPIAIFILADYVFIVVGWQGTIHIPVADPAALDLRADAVGRVHLLAGFVATVVVSVLVCLLFALDQWRTPRRVSARLLVALFIGMMVISGYFALWGSTVRIQEYAGKCFFSEALGTLQSSEAKTGQLPAKDGAAKMKPAERRSPPQKCLTLHPADGKRTLAQKLDTLIKTARAMLIVAATAVIGGAVACLALPGDAADPEARYAFYVYQRKRLTLYVNAAAALMVAGITSMLLWMRWPAIVLTNETQQTSYLELVSAIGLFFGVVYSAMIASYALPISAILRERLDASHQPGASDPAADRSVFDTILKALVLLAPALAGAAPTLMEIWNG